MNKYPKRDNLMKKLLLCFALILVLTACGKVPTEPTAPPTTDESPISSTQASLADFEAFYESFTAAVRNKDMRFIDSILDDETSSSFGGNPGKEYFYEHWDTEKEYNGRDLWAVLEEIVALGGVHYQAGEYFPEFDECFVAPYTFIEADETSFDGGYRLCIEKKDSGWKLLWLIAGD